MFLLFPTVIAATVALFLYRNSKCIWPCVVWWNEVFSLDILHALFY